MQPLQQFSLAALSAKAIRPVDIQLTLALGENYSKKLNDFVNENFVYADFCCEDNGLSKQVRLLDDTGECATISIDEDAIHSNVITVHTNQCHISETFSSFEQFTSTLSKLSTSLCEQNVQASTMLRRI